MHVSPDYFGKSSRCPKGMELRTQVQEVTFGGNSYKSAIYTGGRPRIWVEKLILFLIAHISSRSLQEVHGLRIDRLRIECRRLKARRRGSEKESIPVNAFFLLLLTVVLQSIIF